MEWLDNLRQDAIQKAQARKGQTPSSIYDFDLEGFKEDAYRKSALDRGEVQPSYVGGNMPSMRDQELNEEEGNLLREIANSKKDQPIDGGLNIKVDEVTGKLSGLAHTPADMERQSILDQLKKTEFGAGKRGLDLSEMQLKHSKNTLKNYEDGINKIEGLLNKTKKQEGQMNLMPLLGLVDTWTGSKLSQTYTPPKTKEEKEKDILYLENLLNNHRNKLVSLDLDIASQYNNVQKQKDLQAIKEQEVELRKKLSTQRDKETQRKSDVEVRRGRADTIRELESARKTAADKNLPKEIREQALNRIGNLTNELYNTPQSQAPQQKTQSSGYSAGDTAEFGGKMYRFKGGENIQSNWEAIN